MRKMNARLCIDTVGGRRCRHRFGRLELDDRCRAVFSRILARRLLMIVDDPDPLLRIEIATFLGASISRLRFVLSCKRACSFAFSHSILASVRVVSSSRSNLSSSGRAYCPFSTLSASDSSFSNFFSVRNFFRTREERVYGSLL
jgi:hypothetical protein